MRERKVARERESWKDKERERGDRNNERKR